MMKVIEEVLFHKYLEVKRLKWSTEFCLSKPSVEYQNKAGKAKNLGFSPNFSAENNLQFHIC